MGTPAFVTNPDTSDGAVLRLGRYTCPKCLPFASGGDPDNWYSTVAHEALIEFNRNYRVVLQITGSFSVTRARLVVAEGGDAASCAWRTEYNDGESASADFTFEHEQIFRGMTGFSLTGSDDVDHALRSGDTVKQPELSKTFARSITDNLTSSALCGSTGCTVAELPSFNNDRTVDNYAVSWLGAFLPEKICKSAPDIYKYQVTTAVEVFGGYASEKVMALIYNGVFSEERFAGYVSFPLEEEYTLSGETVIGEIRGVEIKARYLSYFRSLAENTTVGAEGNCPLPSYSSDITTGDVSGSISAVVISESLITAPIPSSTGGGLTAGTGSLNTGGLTTGGLESGGLTTGGLQTGSLTSGSLSGGNLQSGTIESGSLQSGGLTSGGLTSGGLSSGGL